MHTKFENIVSALSNHSDVNGPGFVNLIIILYMQCLKILETFYLV